MGIKDDQKFTAFEIYFPTQHLQRADHNEITIYSVGGIISLDHYG